MQYKSMQFKNANQELERQSWNYLCKNLLQKVLLITMWTPAHGQKNLLWSLVGWSFLCNTKTSLFERRDSLTMPGCEVRKTSGAEANSHGKCEAIYSSDKCPAGTDSMSESGTFFVNLCGRTTFECWSRSGRHGRMVFFTVLAIRCLFVGPNFDLYWKGATDKCNQYM